MHLNEQINAWSRKTFSSIFGDSIVEITTYGNLLLVVFLNKTEYNRASTRAVFTPIKTTTEHYYKIDIPDSVYAANVDNIDSVQFRYPLDNNQELVFPVIQKSGYDTIKNIVSTIYNGHIYEIHFSKDNQSIDEGQKLIIRHMDGTVDNNAIGQDNISGSVELHGHSLFTD